MALNSEDLEKYAKQLDYHIRALVDLTDVMREIKVALDEARKTKEDVYQSAQQRLVNEFASLTNQIEKLGLPRVDGYEMQMNAIRRKLDGESGEWPYAIDPDFIQIDEEIRAENILDMVVMDNLDGVKFLDYGCGTGHVVKEAERRNTTIAVGFDATQDWEFSNSEKTVYTANFLEVKERAPFDVVLLYDVLDHADKPEEILKQIHSILSSKGRLYVRCHPWCSKHGAHLHDQINKAYLHLIMDETELTRLGGYEAKKTNKIFKPIQTYRKWFEKAGFEIQQELAIEVEPDPFFLQDPVLMDRMQRHWADDSIKPYISIDFIDYVLEPTAVAQKVF